MKLNRNICVALKTVFNIYIFCVYLGDRNIYCSYLIVIYQLVARKNNIYFTRAIFFINCNQLCLISTVDDFYLTHDLKTRILMKWREHFLLLYFVGNICSFRSGECGKLLADVNFPFNS